MKYFVITDVHGFYDEMVEALNNAGFNKNNPEHILVSCGDLFDRGKKPRECLEYLMSIPKERRIFVCGNHEDNLIDLINGSKMVDEADVSNGTVGTVLMLNGESTQGRKKVGHILDCCEKLKHDAMLQEYFSELRDYYETDHYIFVHGWIPWDVDDIDLLAQKIFYIKDNPRLWKDYRWRCGFSEWANMRYYENSECVYKDTKKTIVCGHWHVSYTHKRFHNLGHEFPGNDVKMSDCHFEPFIDDGIIGLDACTALTGKCNCVVLED